jgi:hypothetical protein
MGDQCQALPRIVVDHGEHPEATAVNEGVGEEVQAPPCVGGLPLSGRIVQLPMIARRFPRKAVRTELLKKRRLVRKSEPDPTLGALPSKGLVYQRKPFERRSTARSRSDKAF